jgi:nitrous oxide reductase accessory protein NosL
MRSLLFLVAVVFTAVVSGATDSSNAKCGMNFAGDSSARNKCPMANQYSGGTVLQQGGCCHLKSGSSLKENEKPGEAKNPDSKDKCPVCGMFVAKYPGFLAQIQFKNKTIVFFDGPKDLFKYYNSIDHYNPGLKVSDILKIFVTDYYTQSPIEGLNARYVTGSDISGPMGRELVPFEKAAEAEDFKNDHHGAAILQFNDITAEILKSLDK